MIVKISSLTKRYGSLTAVDHLDLEVAEGQLFAFLGPNGAGKSTTINCLTTLATFDSGVVEVAGHRVGKDNTAVQRAIGVVFQDSVLDGSLSVRENLTTRAALYGLSGATAGARIDKLAGQIGLDSFLDQRYATLSGGQRRRSDIARALIHAPRIVFLDEPTGGLDPKGRELVWETVNALRIDDGITVFLTTHYLAETEQADQVAVIDHGKLVAAGTPGELRSRFSTSLLSLTPTEGQAGLIEAALTQYNPEPVAGAIRADVGSADTARRLLIDLGEAVADFEFRHGTMDDVFLALTEQAERGVPAEPANPVGPADQIEQAGGTP